MAGKKNIVEQALKLVAGAEPQKTAKAYKLFRQKDGKLYPLFVDADEEVAIGQWLKAKAGEAGSKGGVKSKIGELAYRPGWHAGDLPVATHIGAKSHGNKRLPPDTRRSDEVWAEVDMADDVDWQKVADERARITKKGTPDPKTAHITDQVPYGGFYRYKTSPTMQGNWMIGGDMRVNRVLTDDEVKAINEAAGVADLPRREGYQTKGRVVGDIVDQAMKLVMGEGDEAVNAGIRAYHGSPHDFDRFDMSKIGTGEGAQAYGHGLYFAEREGIARSYRDALATGVKPELRPTDKYSTVGWKAEAEKLFPNDSERQAAFHLFNQMKNKDYVLENHDFITSLPHNQGKPYEWEGVEFTRDRLAQLADEFYDPGKMYEVDINADPNTFLDWDKPLSEQPEVVRNAIMATKRNLPPNAKDDLGGDYSLLYGPEIKPGQFLNTLEQIGGSPDAGEKLLREQGIPGIKYLDAGSRGKGVAQVQVMYKGKPHGDPIPVQAWNQIDQLKNDYKAKGYDVEVQDLGTRNYVVFDDKLISIIRKYGIAGASAMVGYDLMENLDPKQALAATMADREYQEGRPHKSEGGANTQDPYAEEIAMAKALMSAKAYEDQPWSEWAGDVAQNAVNTAKSILPTALGGRGEVGISDIARGAYEAGKDAVTFPGDVISGKQALFDDRGRPLESAVGRSFNAASTLGGASSVVPRPSNSLGVFGGIKSKTADRNALTQAQIMESRGATPEQIHADTGWHRGAEEQWRYEIPDIGTKTDEKKFELDLRTNSDKVASLSDYFEHPKLYEAYPELKGMEVRGYYGSGPENGFYRRRLEANGLFPVSNPYIGLNLNYLTAPMQRSTLLHEIQHAIQNKEGFAPGSNPRNFAPDTIPNPKRKIYNEALANDQELQEFTSILNSPEYKMEIAKSNKFFDETFKPRILEIQNKEKITGEDLFDEIENLIDEHRKNSRDLFPKISKLDDLGASLRNRNIPLQQPKEFLTPEEAYFQTAGEVEARNVQNRMDMAPVGLKQIPPWKTQEYPNEIQLIDWNDTSWRKGYADGGEVDDDIHDALRIAKDVGGATSPAVMMEDAKGNKYDAQGNIIPPTTPGPNPQRTPTPQEVGQRAAQDPATFDAMMERYAVPDRDIADYKSTRAAVQQQPQQIQQMTHVGAKPRREMTINMPMFGGEYSMGTAPYDVASNLQGMAQGAYDFKTAPAYFFPPTAPFAFGADLLESRMADDPVGLALNLALTPQGASAAKSAGRTVMDVFRQNPKTIGAATGAGAATMSSDEAEAGPARWFSKAVEAARAIPMNKMTGEQALAMLRKGTSPEELRWMGADDFLSGQKQVSKDDLVAFLEKNRVQPKEIVLGGGLKPTRREDVRPDSDIVAKYVDTRDKAYKEYRELNQQIKQAADAEQWGKVENLKLLASEKYREYNGLTERMIDDQIERMGGLARAPKYRDYSTPGGADYRETLTVFGNQQMPNVVRQGKSWTLRDADNNPVLNRAGEPYFYYDKSEADRAAKAIYREGGSYKSSHWDDPNVLFHTRSQVLDVTPPGANRPYKAHNVDETQSDLGQAGRKSGFRSQDYEARIKQLNADLFEAEGQYRVQQTTLDDKYKQEMKKISDLSAADERALAEAVRRGEMKPREFENALVGLTDKYRPMTKPILDKYTREVGRLQETLGSRINSLKQERANLNIEQSKMPAMPFVGSTEGWTDRAIKHELDKALDSDVDYFTWSPGDVHAERYSLDKFIDRVTYNPNTGDFSAYDKDGNVVFDEAIIEEELENYVGKEVADKILAKTNELPVDEDTLKYKGSVKLNNLDLKTGGEGMRGYYDKVYLKRVQEVIRKATGEKPVIEAIEVQTANGPRQQLGIRLTDEMREKARFSDFKKGGRVTGGNAYDSNHTVANALALTREY